ncbi:uracil-DNA glycosylase [Rathayibacter sp. VKM Ac-2760]|uniref:uracil-DNA glycosylase n=1 Tax=Rathayibacter sp. VKM Ac-2760 TaxID=2609253 RepID=UPI001315F1E3|nr:uracil-DNA glycosylase [Rathayibacter sp. VKM Ac-2760]QHC60565.1 uracil-DNA glycosylase [Rathayibacter sp. VKM Ac-2760]
MSAPQGFHDDPSAVDERRKMLESEPSVQPLRVFRDELVARRARRHPDPVVPDFDPAEAGVEARALLVLEAPGPMAAGPDGSGFVSVDNADQTAATLWSLRDEVGLHDRTLIWNMLPWRLDGEGSADVQDVRQGAMELRRLLLLLPNLRVVVNAGTIVRSGWAANIAPHLTGGPTVIDSWSPGQRAMNQSRKRDELRRALERAATLVG